MLYDKQVCKKDVWGVLSLTFHEVLSESCSGIDLEFVCTSYSGGLL